MKDAQRVHHAADEGGPEDMLNQLIEFGYPWSALGSCLKHISNELKTVAEGYAHIEDSIGKLNDKVKRIAEKQDAVSENIRQIIREEIRGQASSMQDRWLIDIAALFMAFSGIAIGIASNNLLIGLIKEYGGMISPALVVAAAVMFLIGDKNSK